jgi:N utilization substance protein A
VRELFRLEVPEITEGIVEVKSISREAGDRSKIAVYSKDEKVDCVGACVGMRGTRVKDIVRELQGEKIDIIRWSPKLEEFVTAALAPAKVAEITISANKKRAEVIVEDDQLSLAIGKRGQNVRLAAKLTGLDIDIRSRFLINTLEKLSLRFS